MSRAPDFDFRGALDRLAERDQAATEAVRAEIAAKGQIWAAQEIRRLRSTVLRLQAIAARAAL